MARKLLIPVLLLAVAMTGCEGVAYFLYLFAPPEPVKTVKAEFAGLAGHNVAIVIYADEKVQLEYPYARLRVASMIAAELRKRIKNIKVIDPRRVVRYQHENIHWDEMDKTKLGKRFGADYALYVTLVEYTTRERGMINLFRGSIVAEAAVYQTSLPERQARVWRVSEIRVLYPPEAPMGQPGEDDRKIRYETERSFTDKLVKKFYKHKAPKNP